MTVRIAVPVTNGALAAHFGHCTAFALFDVDPGTAAILSRQDLAPPPHEPGVLPSWLKEQGATLVIAGGMGSRAQNLFARHNITVIVGADSCDPQDLVKQYLAGRLQAGDNFCDH